MLRAVIWRSRRTEENNGDGANAHCVLKQNNTITMSRWFRSEPMEYISLIVNEDAAHDCLADLGTLGVIQFTDVSFLLAVIACHVRVNYVLMLYN